MRVLILILSIFCSYVNAETIHEECTRVHDTALVVMKMRQDGVPIKKQMDVVEKTGGISNKGSSVLVKMIVEAYETDQFQTEKHKNTSATEFANKWYLACVKSYK